MSRKDWKVQGDFPLLTQETEVDRAFRVFKERKASNSAFCLLAEALGMDVMSLRGLAHGVIDVVGDDHWMTRQQFIDYFGQEPRDQSGNVITDQVINAIPPLRCRIDNFLDKVRGLKCAR